MARSLGVKKTARILLSQRSIRQEIFLDFRYSRINNARPLANLQEETDANFE